MADCLLLVDLQQAFVCGDEAVPDAAVLLTAVHALLAEARSAGALVVHLLNDGPAGAGDEPGTPGWQLAISPLAGEPVVRKVDDNAFEGTQLAEILGSTHVVVMAGVQSEMCVAATARAALRRGLRVVLPHDAHATYDVPPGAGGIPGVPAGLAARAAEWSLGDRVEIPARATQVDFRPAGGDQPTSSEPARPA